MIGTNYILTLSYILFFIYFLSKAYSNNFLVIGELNWMDVINNPISELSNDDEDHVYSNDTSLSFDNNNDYNVDFDSQFERAKIYIEISERITIQNTSSDDKTPSSSANSKKV